MSRQPELSANGLIRSGSSLASREISPSVAMRGASPLDSGGKEGNGGDLSLSNLNLASSPDAEEDLVDWAPSQNVPAYPSQSHAAPQPRTASGASFGNDTSSLSANAHERHGMNEWAKRSKAFAPSRSSFESFASGGAYYSAEEEATGHTEPSSPPRLIAPAPDVLRTPGRSSSKDLTVTPRSKGSSSGSIDSSSSPPITARRASLSSHKTPRSSSLKNPPPSRVSSHDTSRPGSSQTSASASSSKLNTTTGGTPLGRKGRVPSAVSLQEPLRERTSSRRGYTSAQSPSSPTFSKETGSPSANLFKEEVSANVSGNGQGIDIASQPTALPIGTAMQAQTDKHLLQRWILSIGVVNFDLEKGPDLERLWPPLDISREEKDNIAFSSFPDTSIFDVGDISFSFRVREVPLEASTSSPPRFAPSPSTSGAGHSSIANDRPPRFRKEHSRKNGSSGENGLGVKSLFSRASSSGRSGGLADSHQQDGISGGGYNDSGKQDDAKDATDPDITCDRSSIDITAKTALANSQEFDITEASAVLAKEVLATSSVSSGLANVSACKVSNSSSSSYIYGYTFFRQKRDATIRRGYFQKSLVILSHLPYVALFGQIANRLGPLYFEYGDPILEAFASAVTKWPNPSPGATLPLPMVGSVLWVQLPLGRQSQSSNATEAILPSSDPNTVGRSLSTAMIKQQEQRRGEVPVAGSTEEEPLLASIPTTPLVEVFKEALADMWLVWECVLLAEPIFVIGPDPKMCSEAVWHLLDICRPIPHAGDFRPFFTIHDYDFKNLANRKQPPAGTIIGCTNAFMAQACSHWPHVLRVGKAAVKLGTAGKYGSKGSSGIKTPGVAGGTGAGGGGPEHLPGFVSKRKRRISKDRPLLKKIQEMLEKGDNVEGANAMLRRYFTDITERFLAPLNRYISSLIPAEGLGDGANIKPFETDGFLASLKAHGTPLPIRSRSLPTGSAVRQSLYLDFLRSPNFGFYLTERIAFYRTRNPEPSSRKTRFEQGFGK